MVCDLIEATDRSKKTAPLGRGAVPVQVARPQSNAEAEEVWR
jgi:hypothetical protein